MARKRTEHGGFRGIRVRSDGNSGEVNLRLHRRDLREILTAAALNCYEGIEKAKRGPAGEQAETLAYNKGLLQYIRGLEVMLEAQGGYVTDTLAQDPLTQPRTVEERRQAVQADQRERKLFDDILASVLAERNPQ